VEPTDRSGRRYVVVAHRIPEYCVSPGVGIVAHADVGDEAGLDRPAEELATPGAPQLVGRGDRYITLE
jgi:hypothetical protein